MFIPPLFVIPVWIQEQNILCKQPVKINFAVTTTCSLWKGSFACMHCVPAWQCARIPAQQRHAWITRHSHSAGFYASSHKFHAEHCLGYSIYLFSETVVLGSVVSKQATTNESTGVTKEEKSQRMRTTCLLQINTHEGRHIWGQFTVMKLWQCNNGAQNWQRCFFVD